MNWKKGKGRIKMNRQQAKEFFPIIKAFAEGKEIECRVEDKWYKLLEICNETNPQDYRIKPEYRPFKDAKECFEEMQKHKPYGWAKDASKMYNITIIIDDGIIVNTSIDSNLFDFERSFNLKFIDGTPFGIKE